MRRERLELEDQPRPHAPRGVIWPTWDTAESIARRFSQQTLRMGSDELISRPAPRRSRSVGVENYITPPGGPQLSHSPPPVGEIDGVRWVRECVVPDGILSWLSGLVVNHRGPLRGGGIVRLALTCSLLAPRCYG